MILGLGIGLNPTAVTADTSIYDHDLTFDAPELPGPDEPFLLQAYDAVQALWMLRRAGFIQTLESSDEPAHSPSSRRTIRVRNARVVQVEHQLYTIHVNGVPLDWDRSYIRYNGHMRNLRALFSYRNQEHPFDEPLFLD